MARYQTLLLATMVLTAAASCRQAQHAQPTPAPTGQPTSSDGDIAAGHQLYDRYCKLCHGPGAAGYAADNAPQLRNPTFLATATTPFLWVGIERGRPGTPMSGFGHKVGGPLSGEQIRQIVAYLRSLTPVEEVSVEDAVSGDASIGRSVYGEECASCHGDAGEGGEAPSLRNPYFLATASDGFIRYAIEHGRPGTPMGAYGDKLPAEQIDGLTRYIRSWATNVESEQIAGELQPDLSQLVIHPEGEHAQFTNLRDGRYVSAADVAAALEARSRLVILDARATSDWLKSHIPGAYPVPFYDGAAAIVEALPRDDTWIIAYCACPHAASGKIVDQLRKAGFERSLVLDEGILVWIERGYPVTYGIPKADIPLEERPAK